MNILKKQTLKNNNIISDFEIFSLSKNNEFIKCNLLTSSKNFFFINSDCANDFFHKAKKTVFIKSGEYNNQVLLNYKLSKKHYSIQFALLFHFLKKNKIQILRGRILNFSRNVKKKTKMTNSTMLKKKGLVSNQFFIIAILGLVFKFEKKYLTLLKRRNRFKNRKFEIHMKISSLNFFYTKKKSNLYLSRPIILKHKQLNFL